MEAEAFIYFGIKPHPSLTKGDIGQIYQKIKEFDCVPVESCCSDHREFGIAVKESVIRCNFIDTKRVDTGRMISSYTQEQRITSACKALGIEPENMDWYVTVMLSE